MDFIASIKFELNQLGITLDIEDEVFFKQLISPEQIQNPVSLVPLMEQYQIKISLCLLKEIAVCLSKFRFDLFKTHITNFAKKIMALAPAQFNTKEPQSVLAYMYLRGLGVKQDSTEGVKLLVTASDQNYHPANIILAEFYGTTGDKALKKEYLDKVENSLNDKPESEIPESLKKLLSKKRQLS